MISRVPILSVFVCLFFLVMSMSGNNLFLLPDGVASQTVNVLSGDPLGSGGQYQSGPGPVVNVAPAPDGSAYYSVSSAADEAVVTLNANFAELKRTGSWGANASAGVVTPDGKYFLVVADTLRVFDTATNNEVTSIAVGTTPNDIAVDMGSRYALVLSSNSNRLSKVDLQTLQVVGTLSITGQSTGVTAGPNFRFYVTTTNGVRVIDGDAMAEVAKIQLNGTPEKMKITPDGLHGIATNRVIATNVSIWTFDLVNNVVAGTAPVLMFGGLNPIIFDPDIQVASNERSFVYAPQNKVVYEVSIPAADFSVPNVGGDADAIAVSDELPNAKYLYVADNLFVRRYNLATNQQAGDPTQIAVPTGRMLHRGAPSLAVPADTIRFNDVQNIAEGGEFKPVVIRALDANGRPVFNAQVVWESTLEGVVFQDASTKTNADGYATARILPGVNTGIIPATATIGGLPVELSLSVGDVAPGTGGIQKIRGDGQLVASNFFTFAEPLTVRIVNPDGTPVVNQPVSWSITQGEGALDTTVSHTDENGETSARYDGPLVDPGQSYHQAIVNATAGERAANFFITTYPTRKLGGGTAAPPDAQLLSPTLSNPHITGKSGAVLKDAIRVRVTAGTGTESGRGIPNVSLLADTHNTPETGPWAKCVGDYGMTANDPDPVQDGIGSCDLMLGGQLGTTDMIVYIGGHTQQAFVRFVNLSVTVLPGDPAVVDKIGGDQQGGLPGETLPAPLQVEVRDASGTRLAGQAVTWEILTPGNVTLGNVGNTTDGNGRASATATLGTTPGNAQVKVTVGGVSAIFNLNVLVTVTQMDKVSGDGQVAMTGQAFAAPVVVELKDEDNAGVANQTVGFAVTSGSATVSVNTAVTDGSGRASVNVTAGAGAGPVVITASYPGVPSVQFTLNVRLPGPTLTPTSFTNGASGAAGVVPGSVVKIVGPGLAPNIQNCVVPSAQVGALPLELAGVTVEFGTNLWAPIYYVCNNGGVESVAVQAPFELAPGVRNVTVRVLGGETVVQGVNVLPVQPGIFENVATDGKRNAVVMRPDGSFVSPANPAQRGEILAMFVTGMGTITPPSATNAAGLPGQAVTRDIQVGINYAGVRTIGGEYAVNMIGVYVVLFEVPADAPIGAEVALGLSVTEGGERVFANGSTLAIQ